jgi:nitroimidazol reductase NimA-like FMN-containing flavoprotein (pyridoxamine 5'-phosphate oxidase superfamily)
MTPSTNSPQEAAGAIEMLDLSRDECLSLLAGQRIGRVVVVLPNGKPLIRPVNYAFDDSTKSVVIRTGLGSKFHALLTAAEAEFEIDGIDESTRTGWSVIISGVTEEVTGELERERLNALGIDPWGPGSKTHWVRIKARVVSGRRISRVADHAPGYRA